MFSVAERISSSTGTTLSLIWAVIESQKIKFQANKRLLFSSMYAPWISCNSSHNGLSKTPSSTLSSSLKYQYSRGSVLELSLNLLRVLLSNQISSTRFLLRKYLRWSIFTEKGSAKTIWNDLLFSCYIAYLKVILGGFQQHPLYSGRGLIQWLRLTRAFCDLSRQ